MSVYSGSKTIYVEQAINSVLESIHFSRNNNIKIEILIGVDGEIDKHIRKLLDFYILEHHQVKVINFDKNRGLGPVINDLILKSRGTYCIRMDDDDIMSPERIQECYDLHVRKGFDLVSSDIIEFDKDVKSIIGVRSCALQLDSYKSYIRNPLNHVATSFNKEKIIKTGGYHSLRSFEDWNLWLRCTGLRYKKSKKVLVLVRAGSHMASRRRGFAYILNEIAFLRSIFKINKAGFLIFLGVLPLRIAFRMLPPKMYSLFTKKLFREHM